jgi:hypothetical protein
VPDLVEEQKPAEEGEDEENLVQEDLMEDDSASLLADALMSALANDVGEDDLLDADDDDEE